MDSVSEHNGLALGILLARRFDGIPHYHFAPLQRAVLVERQGMAVAEGNQKNNGRRKEKISKRVREKGTPKAERVWHETLSTTEESLTGNRPWLDFFGRHS